MIMRRRNPSLLTTLFKCVDALIRDSLDLPLSPSIDPKHVLSGNYAPVAELPPTACEVTEGALPTCLDGVYLRNGPNPQFFPPGPYHLFDGDGMVQMIKISKGKATFCRRYVKTYKYMVERDSGYPLIPSVLSSFSNGVIASVARVVVGVARVLAGEISPTINGYGTANTSVALIGGRLYALAESDLPYEIQVTPDGDLTTLGRRDFGCSGGEEFSTMTAHPKLDLETGETSAFRYNALFPPFLTFFRIDSDGRKQADVPIFGMKTAAVIHDFAVTKNYAIFNDGQMVIRPGEILKGRAPLRVDNGKTPRLGIISRYAKDESGMRWIDAPGVNLTHVVNAWEEDEDTLVMVATNYPAVELILEGLDLRQGRLEMIRISSGKVEKRALCNEPLDLAVINPDFAGKKNRYVYAPVIATPMIIVGVLKVDVSIASWNEDDECVAVVGTRMYETGSTGSEPFFVAKDGAVDEDDGFVVTYVYDERDQESKFLVMDAKSPSLEIVAAVKLPGRVSNGFHGLFVTQTCLTNISSLGKKKPD